MYSDKTRSKLRVLSLVSVHCFSSPINAHCFTTHPPSFFLSSASPAVRGMTVVAIGATGTPTVIVEAATETATEIATGTVIGDMVGGMRKAQGPRIIGGMMITTTAMTTNDTEAQHTITTLTATMTTVTTTSETTMESTVTIVQSTKVEAGAQ